MAPWFQRINNPILVSSADLHEGNKPNICSKVVVLKINGYLLGFP
jgi:hypothetical protein